MRYLDAATTPRADLAFHRADFGAFELYVAATEPWPDELRLEAAHGRIRALWNGVAWQI